MSTHSSLSVMSFSHTVFLFQAPRRLVYIIVSAAMLRLRLASGGHRASVERRSAVLPYRHRNVINLKSKKK
jgi:hypothetical protein